MIKVTPFRAVRPVKQYVKDVASYPYDVIDSREARILTRDNAKSFLRVVKSEVDFPDDNVDYEKVYEKARGNLYDFLRNGILFQDDKEKFYIYRQAMGGHVQYGVVACVDVADYESGRIKKHELTRKDKELDRTRHIDRVNAQTGPVFLTYKASSAIDMTVESIVREHPEYDFTADDGIAHSVWVVNDENLIETVKRQFGELKSLYIADGHHRAASAAVVAGIRRKDDADPGREKEYNRIMVVIFPHDQLNVMDYNRLISDLGGLDEETFIRRVRERFIITDDFRERSPQWKGEFGMYMNGVWRRLQAAEGDADENDPVAMLDVSILQNRLLKPVLGIDDPTTDDRIRFVGGIRGMNELEKLVDSGKCAVAFSMYPTTVEQLMAVADEGKIMPPKSTWFEPKLRSGIFVHLLD